MKTAKQWLAEIASAKKREKDFRKDGDRIIKIYEGGDKVPFNILFSNVETLLPALYSATPKAVVERRFKDADPIGKAASEAGRRCLDFLIDTNVSGYETFDEAMNAAVLDGLLPGRGVTCVKYDAEVGELPNLSIDDEEPAEGEEKKGEEPTPYKKSELVCLDGRSWNRVYFGYAKKWSKVPYIVYEEHLDEDEAKEMFPDTVANLQFSEDEDEDHDGDHDASERDQGSRKTCLVYQIWDKEGGRQILYVSPAWADGFLRKDEDPLELTDFYNCPKPLQFIEKSNDLCPTAPYMLYENQAKELNELTRRITHIARAIKAKAVYDSGLGSDIKNLVEANDNELVPADTASSLAAEGGLQNALWFWPVEKLITVLQTLVQVREQVKQTIYEITGIADIMRGQSNASETLGAQQIKQSWGTLRLKRNQKEVQRYARDILRISLEIAATKFSVETWAKMTGLPYITAEQKQSLTKQMQFMQMQAYMQAQQAAVQAQQTGQPPQPPQPNPQMQQIQQQLQAPIWEEVLAVLKDDIQRAYKIDIETNSTVEPEAVEDQKNITELMTAIGQYLNGVGPLVANGTMPFQAAQSMLLAITRRYRFGSEIETYIQQMQAPKPPEDGKAQAEQAKIQAQQQQHQAELQANQQNKMEELKLKGMEMQMKEKSEERAAMQSFQLEMARLKAEETAKAVDRQEQMRIEQMKMDKDAASKWVIAKLESETKIAVAEIAAKASIQQASMAAKEVIPA